MASLDPVIYKISRDTCKVFCKLFLKIKVIGKENIPSRGGFVIASNHRSYLDPVAIGVVCPRRINYMARHDLFGVWVLGKLIRMYGVFPVKRNSPDIGALREAIRRVNRGLGLLVFPEGSRQATNRLGQAQAGVGFLASKIHGPVIPAYISGTEKAMPKGARFIKPARVTVRFGEQIIIEGRMPYHAIAAQIMSSIGHLA